MKEFSKSDSKTTGRSPTSSSFELRPLNYYRHPVFDHIGAGEDVNHNDVSPEPRDPPDLPRQVYIRCPGLPMPFRVLVIVAGLIQIDVAVFAIYFWMTGQPIYKHFPQWGPIFLEGSISTGYAPCIWFGIEILSGFWLMMNVWLRVPRPLYTLWLWIILALTMASVVHFCWAIPFKYEQYGMDALGKFGIQLLFHLVLVGIGREWYKQQYAYVRGAFQAVSRIAIPNPAIDI
jgi:hypothetical protein